MAKILTRIALVRTTTRLPARGESVDAVWPSRYRPARSKDGTRWRWALHRRLSGPIPLGWASARRWVDAVQVFALHNKPLRPEELVALDALLDGDEATALAVVAGRPGRHYQVIDEFGHVPEPWFPPAPAAARDSQA